MLRPILLPSFLVLPGFLGAVDFKKDIQPILKAECYKCHSEEAKKEKGGFVFDNLERFAKDIGRGRIIEPGKLGESHFFETLVSPVDDDAHMPPNKQMSDANIAKFREWIQAGAILPAGNAPVADKPGGNQPAPPAAAPATEQDWMNNDGKVIRATMLRMEGSNVVLKLANGQVYNYPLEKLSPTSQALAKRGGS